VQAGNEVTAHYTGKLLDGTVFDSSVSRGQPFKFVLGQGKVIRGWDEGFATMRKGEKAILECKPEYAYGARGSPPKIPANATLRFEVELLSFAPKKKEARFMPTAEKIEEGEKAKESGNSAYSKGDLLEAIASYDRGIELMSLVDDADDYDPIPEEKRASTPLLKVTLYSNKAMACIKAKEWTEAVKAATGALKLDPGHAKSLYRRGSAYLALSKVDEAKADLTRALELSPGDAGIKAELAKVQAQIKAAKEKEKKAFGGMFNRKEGQAAS
jgi:peptidylprolyl isomerase